MYRLTLSFVALTAAMLCLWPTAGAAEKGALSVETVAYQGWKNNLRVSNGDAELIITLDVGPRIISYRLADGKNFFKEYTDQLGKAGEEEWQVRGGHRLLIAPEDPARTYAPDNSPVSYKMVDDHPGLVRITGVVDAKHGLQKELDVQLAAKGSRVTVVHRVKNTGTEPSELAPWAVTALAPGGAEIIPLPPAKPYPGDPKKAKSAADLGPSQTIVVWPYFDRGWNFGTKYLTLHQAPRKGPTKFGLAHRLNWVAYLNDGTLFVKRFDYQEGKAYPDNGCNFETFANPEMLDIETLGPLVKLAPGAAVELTETWDLVGGVGSYVHQFEIDKVVLSKMPAK